MNHLHSEVNVGTGQVVHVALAGQAANVILLDDENYAKYQKGDDYSFGAGGHATQSPVILRPPKEGRWHLVVDLGGAPGQVSAGVTVRNG